MSTVKFPETEEAKAEALKRMPPVPAAARWEGSKRSVRQQLGEMRQREVELLGQIEQARLDLEQLRGNIASLNGGLASGDLAIRVLWEQLCEARAKGEDPFAVAE